MMWSEFATLLADQWQKTTTLEIIGVLFGMLQVLLAFRNSILTYPAGIISTAIYTWMFAQPDPGLYADASLNLYYLIMSIYGWALWSKNKANSKPMSVAHASGKDLQIAAGIALGAFALLYFVLANLTPSTVPVWDSLVSALAWSGMWLLARRKVENWLFLNLSNLIAIPLLFHKQMPLTALLTAFLFTVAVFGYFRWRKLAREEKLAMQSQSEFQRS